jgi:hypothetical protein
MYTKYVGDYSVALNTVNKLSKNPDFTKFLKRQRENPTSEGLDLMSYLIMPVQRVPRYLLLLKELQKYTPDTHPHAPSIRNAMSKIEKTAAHINETQRQNENASALLELQNRIHGLPEELTLFQPHRRLIRHGLLKVLKQENTATVGPFTAQDAEKTYNVVLFNDLILYCTEKDFVFRGWMKLQGCDVNGEELRVEVVRPKTPSVRVQQSIRVETPNEEEQAHWLKSLKEAVEQANQLQSQDQKRKSAAHNSVGSWSR